MVLVRHVAFVIVCGVFGLMAGTVLAQSGSTVAGDALIGELQRCKALREAAATDARCQAAYKQNREQFFAPGAPYEPHAVDMFPKGRNEPWSHERRPDVGAESR